MLYRLTASLVIFLLVGALQASADENASSDVMKSADESSSSNSESVFKRYARWLKYYEKLALEELDLWGNSATIPQGFLVPMFGWGTMRPYGRFDENRELVPLLPVLSFPDPWGSRGKFLEFDFNIKGRGNAYFLSAMYGITDRLMAGISTQFVVMEVMIKPEFTPGTIDKLGIATLDDFYRLMEELGRPRPKTRYKTEGVDWGDTILSTTWNYYRTSWFSTAITGNINVPTAHQADPNKNLIFGLGPDIDTGYGAWGVGATIPFDFRAPKLVKWASFSITGEGFYFFPAKRKSPDFLPIDQDVRDYLESQKVEMDLFQDLTDMDEYYYYTPGPWAAVSAGFGIGPLSIAYRHGWGWSAKFESNSPGFEKMVDYIGLAGEGDDGKIIASLSIPLTPIYIPALAQLRFIYVTDGRNTIVFRDQYGAGIGFFVPLNVPERYKYKKGSER